MVQKIAVVRRNGFGDVLCTIPLILYCKQKWPDSHVTLFIEERAFDLAPYLSGPDRIVILSKGKNKYFSLIFQALLHRKEKFDLAVSAKTSPMRLMNVFLFFLGARKRVAYADRSLDSVLINHRRPSTEKILFHQSVNILRLLDSSIEHLHASLYPRLKGVGEKKISDLPALFYSVSNNRVGCTLSVERAAEILNGLRSPVCIVINCLPQDVHKAEELFSLLKLPAKVCPTGSFSEFLEVLNSCQTAFVGDGGACHLAAALEKPLVALFGGTFLARWKPMTDRAICFEINGHVNQLPKEKVLEALEFYLSKEEFRSTSKTRSESSDKMESISGTISSTSNV